MEQGTTMFRRVTLSGMIFVLAIGALCEVSYADLYVSAASANSVMRFDETTGAFKGFFVAPNAGGLGNPQGIAFGPDNNLYVASQGSRNVLRYNGQSGEFIDVFANLGDSVWPAEINFRGNHLYVSDFANQFTVGRVSRFDANTGAFVDHFVTGASFADGQEWDANGDFYLSNFGTNSIRKYDGETGALLGDFVSPNSGGLFGPLDNLFLPNGELLVSSFNTGSVKRYDANGNYIDDPITNLPGGPQGLVLGPDGYLYAGDFGFGRINRYDAETFEFLGTFADASGQSTTNNFVFFSSVPEPNAIWFLAFVAVCLVCYRLWRWRAVSTQAVKD